ILKFAALGAGAQCVWTRPDDGHRAFQDVEQLRQLIDAPTSEETPDPGHAGIVAACLSGGMGIGVFVIHGAEFPQREYTTVEALAALAKQHRPTALEPD